MAKTKSERDREEKRRKIVYNTTKEVAEKAAADTFARTFKVPEGTTVFKFKAVKRYRLNVIPFIAGAGNPRSDEGKAHYERTFQIHVDIGPKRERVVCGHEFRDEEGNPKPCAVCDHQAALRRKGKSWEETKHLAGKQRQLWLFEDQDELEAGVQIMEASYFGKGQGFGEMVQNKLDSVDEDSAYHSFFWLDGGSTLSVKTKEDKYQGRVFYKPVNIEVVPRKKVYPDSILDKVPCLDELLIETPYDRVVKMLAGGVEDEDDGGDLEEDAHEDVVPAERGKKPKPVRKPKEEEPEPEEEDLEADEEQEVEEEPEPEEEEETVEIGPGSRVEYTKGGKSREATVVKILEAEGKAVVKIDGDDKNVKVSLDTLSVLEEVEEEPEPEEEEVEEEPEPEEEEVEEVEDEEDNDTFSADEDEFEEEPEPAPKKKVVKKK